LALDVRASPRRASPQIEDCRQSSPTIGRRFVLDLWCFLIHTFGMPVEH